MWTLDFFVPEAPVPKLVGVWLLTLLTLVPRGTRPPSVPLPPANLRCRWALQNTASTWQHEKRRRLNNTRDIDCYSQEVNFHFPLSATEYMASTHVTCTSSPSVCTYTHRTAHRPLAFQSLCTMKRTAPDCKSWAPAGSPLAGTAC